MEPDSEEEKRCRICGTICLVERSLTGPTGWVEAAGGRGHWHDKFFCPNSEQDWHEKALKLLQEINLTLSKRLAALMQQHLEDILRENGCL